jgi:hypothetical protein
VIGRRSFLLGIAAGIAAPAIVRPASIMRVNALLIPNILTFHCPPYPKLGDTFTIVNAAKELLRITGWGDSIDFLPGDVGDVVYLGDGKRSLIPRPGRPEPREDGAVYVFGDLGLPWSAKAFPRS